VFVPGPNEYYFSPEAQQLYLYYNGTGSPPPDSELVATQLQTYISIEGTLAAPVQNITIQGIAFRDAVRKRIFLCKFILNENGIYLPRQARDKHRKSSTKDIDMRFYMQAETGLEPHGVPSCGDWALQRLAALFIEGTEGTTVDSCSFTRMDGNGLMLSRYNRHATISNNEFAYIGDSAMAAWGYTDEFSANGTQGYDARDGDFPVRSANSIMRMFWS
jgi:hypothetical protein